MCDELFKAQLSPQAQEHMTKLYEYRDKEGLVSFSPSGKEISFSLSGMLNLADVEGRRRAGTIVGGGVCLFPYGFSTLLSESSEVGSFSRAHIVCLCLGSGLLSSRAPS
jgi:hypothetical protein